MSNFPKSIPKSRVRATFVAALPVCLMFAPAQAFAYIGPGAGLSAIGSFLALLAAVAVTIVGFVWYPIKRLLKKNKTPQAAADTAVAETPAEAVHAAATEEKPAE